MSSRRVHVPMLPSPSARLLPWVQHRERRGKLVISAHGINADHLTSSLAGGAAVPTGRTPAPALLAPIANLTAEPRACFTVWLLFVGGVSVPQLWREVTHVPDHGLILSGMDGTVACSRCRCWVPALGMGIGTARMPGVIEQKPPFGCRKVFELLPCSRLTSPLSFCPFAGFGVIPLASASLCGAACSPEPGQWAERGDKYPDARTVIYLLSQHPAGPWPSLWVLRPLRLFVSFFTHFSGRCVFTSPVCFECRGG